MHQNPYQHQQQQQQHQQQQNYGMYGNNGQHSHGNMSGYHHGSNMMGANQHHHVTHHHQQGPNPNMHQMQQNPGYYQAQQVAQQHQASQSQSFQANHNEGMQKATQFFSDLKHTTFPQLFDQVGSLNDFQRVLQLLNNTSYVENKNHNMLTRQAGADTQQQQMMEGQDPLQPGAANLTSSINQQLEKDNQLLTGQDGMKAQGLASQQSMQDCEFDLLELEGNEQEELEARKILSKRRRRVGKIEDVGIDIDSLFAQKKRFKPDDSTSETVVNPSSVQLATQAATTPDLQLQQAKHSFGGATALQTKGLLRQNLLSQYMEQVSEHDMANQTVLNIYKSMIKLIQVGRQTSDLAQDKQELRKMQLAAVTRDEQLLITYVIETEPDLFTDVVSYWLFSKFMAEPQSSNFTTEETAYEAVLEYILSKFESDSNLVLHNERLFSKWIKFLIRIPDLKSQSLKSRLEHHLRTILNLLKTTNLKQLFRILITELLIKRVGVKKDLQRCTVDYLQSILVVNANSLSQLTDFYKSVALFQLIFEEQSLAANKTQKVTRLAISETGTESEQSLFSRMAKEDQQVLRDAILQKFKSLPQMCNMMTVEEMRLTIKLMIYSCKQEARAFKDYVDVLKQVVPIQGHIHQLLNSILLQDLKELLDLIVPTMKSDDQAILAIFNDALNQSNNRQYLVFQQAFLGAIVDYFCQAAKHQSSRCRLSSSFINMVIRLTKLKTVDFSHFGYPLIEYITTIKEYEVADFSKLSHLMSQCFLRESMPALTEQLLSIQQQQQAVNGGGNPPTRETVQLTPQKVMDIIEKLSKISAASDKEQPVDLAILLLSSNSEAIVQQAALAESQQQNQQQATESQKAVLSVMKKQISLSSLIAYKSTSVPLQDCLSHQVLLRLISEQHWRCIFLMRLVLLFLKQAKTVAPLDEVVQIGVNLVDKILSAKPWWSRSSSSSSQPSESESFWPNLKRGLCFFAAEYNGKSPLVAEVYRKHLMPADNTDDNPILKEFCEESPIMREILTAHLEKQKEQQQQQQAAVAEPEANDSTVKQSDQTDAKTDAKTEQLSDKQSQAKPDEEKKSSDPNQVSNTEQPKEEPVQEQKEEDKKASSTAQQEAKLPEESKE